MCDSKVLHLKFVGMDSWDRPVYKDDGGTLWKDVDPRAGMKPNLCIYRLEAAHVGDVVNTLGAGDALFSCFINYYMKGYSAVEALTRAEIFAALKIRYNGAANGFSSEDIVERYYRNGGVAVREVISTIRKDKFRSCVL